LLSPIVKQICTIIIKIKKIRLIIKKYLEIFSANKYFFDGINDNNIENIKIKQKQINEDPNSK